MRPDTIALLFATIPAVLFTVLYINELRHVRRTAAALHLIGFSAVVSLFLLEELFRRSIRDAIPIEMHRVFVAAAGTLAALFLWQRLWLLLSNQILPRRRGEFAHENKQRQKEDMK